MHEEIEAKLKVDSLEDVERRLRECGAAFLRETVQTDVYLDTADSDLTRCDKCLRLRREKAGRRERLILAYKGPKQQDDYKKRAEVELGVSDADGTELLFAALGYHKALAFNKRRRLWRLQECEVALDELPLLGAFVEIEGPDSRTILHVQEMLGLSDVPHTMDSYASLIDQELSRLGEGRREVYLEDRK
jgi:adenylate cyclase class 2